MAWGGWFLRKPRGSFSTGQCILAKRAMWAMVVWPQTKPSIAGQPQNGLKGMAHSPGPPGVRHLLQTLEQRIRRLHIYILPYLTSLSL